MDFVCFSVNNWEERRARKQQFMLHLSLRADVGRVVYVEPAVNIWRFFIFWKREFSDAKGRARGRRAWGGRMERIPESQKFFVYTPLSFFPWSLRFPVFYRWNLWLILFFLRPRLRRLGLREMVLWLYHPFDAPLLDWFSPRRASCFDWAEKWSEYFLEYRVLHQQMIARLEEEVVRRADRVFVTSQRLLDMARPLNPRSCLLRDGTVPGSFAAFDGRIPRDLEKIPHPVIGYAGTFYERVDQGLVLLLSRRFPSCSFVFVGNIAYDRVDVATLASQKNIHFLGGKPYALLPGYIMNFDVCLLPYIFDSKTAAPTKIYDYLASGKPIVATSLPELEYLTGCVNFARTGDEFIAAVKRSLEEARPEVAARCRRIAQENSWEMRAEEIIRLIA